MRSSLALPRPGPEGGERGGRPGPPNQWGPLSCCCICRACAPRLHDPYPFGFSCSVSLYASHEIGQRRLGLLAQAARLTNMMTANRRTASVHPGVCALHSPILSGGFFSSPECRFLRAAGQREASTRYQHVNTWPPHPFVDFLFFL